ncbi:MAG: hypothetical protein RR257_06335 [Rikenellaceae bacterium]
MRKTGSEIEGDMVLIIKGSQLAGAVNGGVYVDGTTSNKEDIVVSFQSGIEGSVQTGCIEVNIYVPDIGNSTDGFVKNAPRCLSLEQLVMKVVNSMQSVEYAFYLGETIHSPKVLDVNQHFVNVKLKFKRSIN